MYARTHVSTHVSARICNVYKGDVYHVRSVYNGEVYHVQVLFVRDPYARLWSVYVDKFVLPDSWLDHGISIVQRRTSAERRTKACANDVDFEEFITYAVRSNFDPHWRPIHRVCNPCLFHPRYVGKVGIFFFLN